MLSTQVTEDEDFNSDYPEASFVGNIGQDAPLPEDANGNLLPKSPKGPMNIGKKKKFQLSFTFGINMSDFKYLD